MRIQRDGQGCAGYGLYRNERAATPQYVAFAIFSALLFQAPFVGAFMFSVLYGGNLILAIDRVANFLKRAVGT
jgi:hypothetical protein